MRSWLVLLVFVCGLAMPASAADFASQISAYRRAHGLSSVQSDAKLNAVALYQARAMAANGVVSHTVGGSFVTRIANLRKRLAAENIAAGFASFAETMKQWENSAGHRQNLLMVGARKVGIASAVNRRSPYGVFWAMVITD